METTHTLVPTANDYWFRYKCLHLQLTLGSTAQLGQSAALYS